MNTGNAVIVVALLLAQLEHPEPIFPNPDNFAHVDSCPLVLRVSSKSRYVSYENSSSSSVVAIRFGCVRKSESAFRVVSEYDAYKLAHILKPGWSTTFTAEDLNSKVTLCLKGDSRLAIVFVGFSDGGAWQISRP